MTILAKDTTVGEIYHSPKGIPCKVIDISENEVRVRSLITSQDISIPSNLPLYQQGEFIDESSYTSKVVRKNKKQPTVVVKKVKEPKENSVTVASILRDAMLKIETNQSTSYDEMIKKAQETFPEVSADKLFNRVNMTIQGLKKQGVFFIRRKGQIIREK